MRTPRFRPARAVSMARKETRHVLRDPFTLAWALGMPILLVVFFGYAIDFNVEDVHLAVADRDRTRFSRELLEVFGGSGYFDLRPVRAGDRPMGLLDQERTKGVLVVEPGFGRDLGAGEDAGVQILLDGADNSTTGIILGYLEEVRRYALARSDGGAGGPFRLASRYLFNPEQNSRWFVVPGLAVVVIGLLSIMLTALTVAREWETGSMERLLATPIRPFEIIVGKLLPYLVLVLLSVALVYGIARLQFGIPFRGSHLIYAAGVLLFLTLCLAQGLLISVATRQQMLAMQLGFISGLLPTLLLSGFIFPIESMPDFFQILTMILPPRWFMVISRGLFLKGAGPVQLAVPLGMLALLNLILVGASLRAFKKDLEP